MSRTAAEIVQAQLDAYNAQDVDALCIEYDPGVVISNLNGDTLSIGLEAFRSRHVALFAQHPANRAKLTNRIVVGDVVIDHEHVERSPGGETFQVAAIYTLRHGKIVRTDFVKAF